MSGSAIRSTQRAPQSCAACTKRKVRCSKTIPCTGCLGRGQGALCQRETVSVKGRVMNTITPRSPDLDDLQLEIIRLKTRIAELEGAVKTEEVKEEDTSEEPNSLDTLIQGFDLMSMGLSATPTIPKIPPLANLDLPNQPSYTPREVIRSLVPARPLTDALLEYAYKWTWWHHGSYHVPIFKTQVDRMWASGGGEVSWSWTAMLMAILAESLFYMDDRAAKAIGFSTDQIQTFPDLWCRASLHCMWQADMLVKHTMSSIQTILIICGITNALGHSTLHTTLLPLGLAIARSLKLHRLGVEPICQMAVPGTLCVAHGTSEPHVLSDFDLALRESGRRVWTMLQIHDRLSWQARETRGTSLVGDSVPLNIDDVPVGEVAIVRPTDEPTMISHVLAMGQCAAAVHDYLISRCSPSTALAKVDARLKELIDLPSFKSDKYEHIPWSRHIWILCVQHKRLVIHRPYFARSFREAKHGSARRVCVEAAHAILVERRNILPPSYEKPWVVLFDTLAAAVVLAIDFFHSSPSGIDTRRSEIYELLGALTRGLQQNVYVQRASSLLLSLLAEEDKFRASFAEQAQQHLAQRQTPSDGLSPRQGATNCKSPNNSLPSQSVNEEDIGISSNWADRVVSDPDIMAWLNLDVNAADPDATADPLANSSFLFDGTFDFPDM